VTSFPETHMEQLRDCSGAFEKERAMTSENRLSMSSGLTTIRKLQCMLGRPLLSVGS
jgi:hypothetical protein